MRWWIAFLGGRHRLVAITWLVLALFVSAIGGIFAHRFVPGDTPTAHGEALMRSRQFGAAERVLWDEIRRGPVTVPLLVAFFDNHHTQITIGPALNRGEAFVVDESDVDATLQSPAVPEEVRDLGGFWRTVLKKDVPSELRDRVVALANREPPAPYANRLLGLEAHRQGRLSDAAARFEREGLSFEARNDDLALAMNLLMLTDAWDEIGERVRDPRVRPRLPPQVRYAYAVRVKDVPLALRAIVASAMAPRPLTAVLLASISGVMWLLFAFRMGRAGEKPRFRVPLFLAAFVLGVISILPTLVVVGLEESLLHFRERGELVSDLIFFTVGVGLREELCKLLLFLPLLPVLRRRGTRLDVLTCGALVGLGFATEENVNYLQAGLTTALARFLTANFLHMALSAMLALAVYDLANDDDRDEPKFSRTLLTVVGIHGAYDFFLSNPQVEGLSFLSMTIFVILTRMFMTQVRQATTGPGAPLLPRFLQAVVVVTCASFIYASAFVGPVSAGFVLAQGLLGMILIVVMFVQEMRRF